jgi:hypothetical protein
VLVDETHEHPALLIKGQFLKGDAQHDVTTFATLAAIQKKPAIVFLESTGGIIGTAIRIGQIIHEYGFSTAVADETVCTSSCAIIWLAGKERFIATTSHVGFHASYKAENHEVSSSGNAIVGAYLYEIGLRDPATIVYVTEASPQSMTWLTINDAMHHGIAARAFSLSQNEWSWAKEALTGLDLHRRIDPPVPVPATRPTDSAATSMQRRTSELQSDIEKITAERERISARLIETGRLIRQSEVQQKLIESRLGELEVQETLLRKTLEARHGSISGLLAVMQRMGRNPQPVLETPREDALSMVRSAMLLAAAFPELRGQLTALADQLSDLLRVKDSIRVEGERLRTETSRLVDVRTRLAGLQESKRQSLAERQAELAQVRQAIDGMEVPPLAGFSGSPEKINVTLQATPLWRILKRDFPDWYAERLMQAAALAAQNMDDGAIGQQMARALVALRRQNFGYALAASFPKLKAVAATFYENLVDLQKQSDNACFDFISRGETSPTVVALLQGSPYVGHLQAQLTAVFEAIADGRTTGRVYPQPRKSDYDALASDLTQRGWTQADMQLFSDERALAHAGAAKVCQLVRDWFAAQLAIQDADMQQRLLADSLKPVVAGRKTFLDPMLKQARPWSSGPSYHRSIRSPLKEITSEPSRGSRPRPLRWSGAGAGCQPGRCRQHLYGIAVRLRVEPKGWRGPVAFAAGARLLRRRTT